VISYTSFCIFKMKKIGKIWMHVAISAIQQLRTRYVKTRN
jgi:hypothetical protein